MDPQISEDFRKELESTLGLNPTNQRQSEVARLQDKCSALVAQIKAEKYKLDFVAALKIAEGVMEKYRVDQPKWWKRMDGTPILNDLPTLMAEAFVLANNKGATDAPVTPATRTPTT